MKLQQFAMNRTGAVAIACLLAVLPIPGTPQAYGSAKASNTAADVPTRIFMPGELTEKDVLEALSEGGSDKGYTPRKTHKVNAEDLAACPDLGGGMADLEGMTKGMSGRSMQIVIEFGRDSVTLSALSQNDLLKVAQGLEHPQFRTARIVIEGHANRDARADVKYNHRLSCERAAKVREVLRKKHGISGDRLQAVGLGFSQPAEGLDAADIKNRRVVIRRLL